MTNMSTNTTPANDRNFGVELEFTGIDTHTAAAAIAAKGIEVQSENYNHRRCDHWKIVYDASCGLEAVSPVLHGEEGLRQVALVCDALSEAGAKVDRGCGYHVHLDVADFRMPHFKNLMKLWIKFEDVLDTFQPASRRSDSNHYCRSNLSAFGNATDGASHASACRQAFRCIDQCRSIEDLGSLFGNRYVKLNVQAYFRHRTIEVRHHAGTLNADKAVNWVRLMLELYQSAKEATTVRARPSNHESGIARHKWFFQRTAPKGLRRFYTKRARQLAAAA